MASEWNVSVKRRVVLWQTPAAGNKQKEIGYFINHFNHFSKNYEPFFFSLFWNERKRGAAGFTFLQEIIEENDHSLTLIWKIKREKNNGGWYKTPKRNQKMKVGIYSWTNGQWMMTWCDLNLDYANQGVLEGVLNGRLIVTKEHPAP